MTGMLVPPEDADLPTLRRSTETLDRLMQVSILLNSTLDITKLLEFIMDAAAEITKSEGASVLLMNENTRQLHFVASTSADIDQSIAVPLEGSLAGAAFTEERPVIANDVDSDPRHFSRVDRKIDYTTRSIASVPMRIKDTVIGVLQAVNKKEPDPLFGEGDVLRLTSLAAQAAIAIENAQLVEELQDALDELDQLDKLKSDFIAIASHELRTPLGVILGYASFLLDEAQGEASDHAQVVLSSALRMREILEAMTNLTYLQTDDTEFNMQSMLLNDLLSEAQQHAAEMAAHKRQSLQAYIPAEPVEIVADREMLLIAVNNVLNNAIKYTGEEGTINLSLELKQNEAWVAISDSGIGMQPDQIEHVFDQFYQAEDHMTRNYEGLGLGLSISKGVIDKHGGRIWVESVGPNQGSTVYISLPLAS